MPAVAVCELGIFYRPIRNINTNGRHFEESGRRKKFGEEPPRAFLFSGSHRKDDCTVSIHPDRTASKQRGMTTSSFVLCKTRTDWKLGSRAKECKHAILRPCRK